MIVENGFEKRNSKKSGGHEGKQYILCETFERGCESGAAFVRTERRNVLA